MRRSIVFTAVTALTAGTFIAIRAQSTHIPPVAEQIAAAVLPLPAELREAATVLGYSPNRTLTTLRAVNGPMVCLANNPGGSQFHVACYHRSLEPFMARGRALRNEGVKDPEVDSIRFREAKQGTLRLPDGPAGLYSLTGGMFDAATGSAPGSRALYVVYIPYATERSTGISERPREGAPWIMFPGTPKAHIMFVPGM